MNSPRAILLAYCCGTLVLAGCSEKISGSLHCPASPGDTLTVYAEPEIQHVTVLPDTFPESGKDPGMAGLEALYLGSGGGTKSSILVNFDFATMDTTRFPRDLFTIENIKSVKLSLLKYQPYAAFKDSMTEGGYPVPVPSGRPLDLYYDIRQLERPFDPADYHRWPGPSPATLSHEIHAHGQDPNPRNNPVLRIYPDLLVDWLEQGEIGLEVSLLPHSDPGMVGYVAREARRLGSQVGDLGSWAIAAPHLVVEFENNTLEVAQIPPSADTSTFETVGRLPEDQIHVQTGLQSYSILTFDVPPLPNDTCLADLGFSLHPVEFDPLWIELDMCMAMAMVDTALVGPDVSEVLESDLLHALVKQGNLCWVEDDKALDSPVIPEQVRIMIYYPGTLPYDGLGDLYFTQNIFHGPTAPEPLRPALKLIYGRAND